jgi:hypothetical protein
MRLWSIHPRLLDAAGLVAVWREGLLARAVLCGKTRGYRRHPQLNRFRATRWPTAYLDTYLAHICDEADRRGYSFDRSKLGRRRMRTKLAVTRAQLRYEWRHLKSKLERRRPAHYREALRLGVSAHPMFLVTAGPVADWERVTTPRTRRLRSR